MEENETGILTAVNEFNCGRKLDGIEFLMKLDIQTGETWLYNSNSVHHIWGRIVSN